MRDVRLRSRRDGENQPQAPFPPSENPTRQNLPLPLGASSTHPLSQAAVHEPHYQTHAPALAYEYSNEIQQPDCFRWNSDASDAYSLSPESFDGNPKAVTRQSRSARGVGVRLFRCFTWILAMIYVLAKRFALRVLGVALLSFSLAFFLTAAKLHFFVAKRWSISSSGFTVYDDGAHASFEIIEGIGQSRQAFCRSSPICMSSSGSFVLPMWLNDQAEMHLRSCGISAGSGGSVSFSNNSVAFRLAPDQITAHRDLVVPLDEARGTFILSRAQDLFSDFQTLTRTKIQPSGPAGFVRRCVFSEGEIPCEQNMMENIKPLAPAVVLTPENQAVWAALASSSTQSFDVLKSTALFLASDFVCFRSGLIGALPAQIFEAMPNLAKPGELDSANASLSEMQSRNTGTEVAPALAIEVGPPLASAFASDFKPSGLESTRIEELREQNESTEALVSSKSLDDAFGGDDSNEKLGIEAVERVQKKENREGKRTALDVESSFTPKKKSSPREKELDLKLKSYRVARSMSQSEIDQRADSMVAQEVIALVSDILEKFPAVDSDDPELRLFFSRLDELEAQDDGQEQEGRLSAPNSERLSAVPAVPNDGNVLEGFKQDISGFPKLQMEKSSVHLYFNEKTKTPICQVFRACMDSSGKLLVPLWMAEFETFLKICGFDPVFELHENAFEGQVAVPFDFVGSRPPRSGLPLFVKDMIPILFSLDIVLGKKRYDSHKCQEESGALSVTCDALDMYPGLFMEPSVRSLLGDTQQESFVKSFLSIMVPKPRGPYFEFWDKKGPREVCFRSITSTLPITEIPYFPDDGSFYRQNNMIRESIKEKLYDGCPVQVTGGYLDSKEGGKVSFASEFKKALVYKSKGRFFSAGVPGLNVSAEFTNFDDLNFTERIATMQAADVFVAGHSDVLSNIIYLRRHSAVVEILPFAYIAGTYFEISSALNLRHKRIVADPDTKTFSDCILKKAGEGTRDYATAQELLGLWRRAVSLFEENGELGVLRLESSSSKRPSLSHERSCARNQFLSVDVEVVAKTVLQAGTKFCNKRSN